MEYLKITPKYGLTGIVKVTKYEGVRSVGSYGVIDNVIQTIWYNEDAIKFYRYKRKNFLNIEGKFTVEIITKKKYYNIVNELKERRIVKCVKKPNGPYIIDVDNSTNTRIKFIPKSGFELGYRKVTTLEWFETLDAAYPITHLEPFVNQPYEVKVDTKKYKGYKFVSEESTTEKSVYKIIWPSKRKFKKDCEFFYL